MFDWATAAFMKRRSRIVLVMAIVPTAAQAACRMNSRRDWNWEEDFRSIKLFLDRVVWRGDDHMDRRPDAVAHLGIGRWRIVREISSITGARDEVDDSVLGAAGELAAQ